MKNKINKMIEKIDKKKRINPQGKNKIADVLENKEVDFLPLIFWKPQHVSVPGETFDMEEQFFNKEKMLYGHLEEIERCAENAFDAPICIRPNFGTIFIPAMFGLTYNVPKDTFAWLTSRLNKEEIKKFNLPNIDKIDMFKKTVEYIKYFKETLPDWIHVYLPDTLGPFEIAHAVYGNNIYYDFYDDSKFVHYLLNLCTDIYIQITEKLKEVLGEELSQETAHALVIKEWGDCSLVDCENLIVSILDGKDGVWFVQAVYEGLRDDSVKTKKEISLAHYVDGDWILGSTVLLEYKCQLGRGHQDFSEDLCL